MRLPRALLPLATSAVIGASVLPGAGAAHAAKTTWKSGETASYTVRVPHGPVYRVSLEVPTGFTMKRERSPATIDLYSSRCLSGWPVAPHLEGFTFADALRDGPGFGERRVHGGSGTGGVRWAGFEEDVFGEERYVLFALHPRVLRKDFVDNQYYGFQVSDLCLSRPAARKLVRTLRITPLKR
ncbi:MAG: hypothetical protein QOE05_386 [Actinomycetota bacterium]|nr:hypothetical protein [Actinomycetota bacterium]